MSYPQLFHHCTVQFVPEFRTIVCCKNAGQTRAHEYLDIHVTLYSAIAT